MLACRYVDVDIDNQLADLGDIAQELVALRSWRTWRRLTIGTRYVLHRLDLGRVGSDHRLRAVKVLPDHVPAKSLLVKKITELRGCHRANMPRKPRACHPRSSAASFKPIHCRGWNNQGRVSSVGCGERKKNSTFRKP